MDRRRHTRHDILGFTDVVLPSSRRRVESRTCTDLLEPMETMALDGGPMNTIPSSASRSANLAFSLRKPYLHIRSVRHTPARDGRRLTQDARPTVEKKKEPSTHDLQDTYNTDLGTALATHLDDRVHAQLNGHHGQPGKATFAQTNTTHITLGRRRRTDAIRLVGVTDVQRLRVRVAIHRYSLDPQLLGCPDHTACDLPPETCA
jgi:hypothetical protein